MNITKFHAFVILTAVVGIASAACTSGFFGEATTNDQSFADVSPFEKPSVTGKLGSNELNEASGITASLCQQNVYWTHNDSGDDAYIYAIDQKGANLGVWRVVGAENIDWEDIASYQDATGKCTLLIGDIGNNERKRDVLKIYKVAEPQIAAGSANLSKKDAATTESAEAVSFSYPDGTHNAEALLVQPDGASAYVLTKRKDGPSKIFKIRLTVSDVPLIAENIGEIAVPAVPNGSITGGDISVSGKSVVLCDYFAAYELVLPPDAKNFDEIWKQKPVRFDPGKRDIGEAIAYTGKGGDVIAISENKHAPVYVTTRRLGR